jgi:hypothetical protein
MRRCCLIHLKNSSTCQRLLYSAAIVNAGNVVLLVRNTSVLPTFMRHPGSFKPASIANRQSEIQIVDTHESLETRISIGLAAC